MFSQLFGKYLVEKEIISDHDYRSAIKEQLAVRVKLGTIAVAEGLLSEEEVELINKLQMQLDKRFGDIAIEKGFLTPSQLDDLLKKQGNPYMQFIQVLMESGKLPGTVLERTLAVFQKEKGFSDSEMTALKNDDIDALIPIFAFSSKPYITDIAGLVVRNINRFITRDFYIGKIQRMTSLTYCHLAGQKTHGNDNIYIALAEEFDEGSFTKIASSFSGTAHDTVTADSYDVVCEFININSGLFATEMSQRDVNLDMEPVFAYSNQTVTGDFYALPIYIEGHKINLILAVNADVNMGTTTVSLETCSDIVYEASPDSKGTIILVDDSKMSRNMLKAILEEDGYAVIAEASNGEEALEVYKKHKPDLITLDITMPKMDGIELLKRLMDIDPSVKAIMITAAGQQSKLIEALKVGAKRFITKPFEKEEILLNINEVMNE